MRNMTAITFDTLQYTKRLREVGVSEEQAEVQAEAIRELIDDKLATKEDIKLVRKDMKELEQRLSYKLTMRLGSMLVAAVLVLAAIIKL